MLNMINVGVFVVTLVLSNEYFNNTSVNEEARITFHWILSTQCGLSLSKPLPAGL